MPSIQKRYKDEKYQLTERSDSLLQNNRIVGALSLHYFLLLLCVCVCDFPFLFDPFKRAK